MIDFKLYSKNDYENVIKVWKKSGLILTTSDEKDEIQLFADHDSNQFYLLILDNTIIGTIICAFDGRRGYIHHVSVIPEYQNQGFGKQLMDKAMNLYKLKNIVKVHIFIEKSNQKVVSYYKKLGWLIRDDLIMMTKTLRD